ncbi:MAG: hypothetical protein MHM6MM_005851, partial [Cercozoa sp. M6MM]
MSECDAYFAWLVATLRLHGETVQVTSERDLADTSIFVSFTKKVLKQSIKSQHAKTLLHAIAN